MVEWIEANAFAVVMSIIGAAATVGWYVLKEDRKEHRAWTKQNTIDIVELRESTRIELTAAIGLIRSEMREDISELRQEVIGTNQRLDTIIAQNAAALRGSR